ncbi:MAG: molecular chaperone TorD family protein [Rhodocyclales bacterium]|nr:molecular chaperone TorD family protein [Rhodocyclales bacterium]
MTAYPTGIDGAREDLCRYLAACYYEPSAAFAEERLFDSIRAAAAAIEPDLAEVAERLGAAFAATDVGTLLVDYTRLFIGPGQPRALPYASFWLTDDPSQRHEATQVALDFYEQGGLDVGDDLPELPDHAAVELEFLYRLIHAANAGLDDPANDAPLYSRFVSAHLGAWIPAFAKAVDAGAETGFYKALGEITERFVRAEQNRAMTLMN